MSVNIGNQFDYGREEIDYGKVPLWDRVDEQYPSGVFVKVTGTYTVGKLIPAGTPVQIDHIGAEPKIGSAATAPTGLTRYDATVGSNGCTLTVVTRGAIYADRISGTTTTLSSTQRTALKERILFISEVSAD